MFEDPELQEDVKDLMATPENMLRKLDVRFEQFFYQWDYTLENFNFYLQAISNQYWEDLVYTTLEKMKTIGLVPNEVTYTHMIATYAWLGNVDKVEEIIKEATYNGL